MPYRARVIYTFTLVSGVFMLLESLIHPPHSLWRVFFDIILPIAIILASAWGSGNAEKSILECPPEVSQA